jgi:GntR family transcriptional regulator
LRLPANEVLAAEFGVSRVTIRQAVDLLARDGILEPGKVAARSSSAS